MIDAETVRGAPIWTNGGLPQTPLEALIDWLSKSLDKTYLQFNLYNAFDKFYVGGFGGALSQSVSCASVATGGCPNLTSGGVYASPPFVQIGAPRTFSASINVQF